MGIQKRNCTKGSSSIAIRAAIIGDVKHIAEIAATTFRDSFAHSMPEQDMVEYLQSTLTTEKMAEQVMDPSQNKFFVATTTHEGDYRVVGFIQIKIGTTEPCIPSDADLCEVHRIYISSKHTGAGTGKMLMDRGLSWAQSEFKVTSSSMVNRKPGIWLGVWEENHKAQRFYERFGFEKIGQHDFVMGATTQTDHVMMRWLSFQSSSEDNDL